MNGSEWVSKWMNESYEWDVQLHNPDETILSESSAKS